MFDTDKPMGSGSPIGKVCPKCGSAESKAVKAQSMIAFTDDRVCKQCSTRYTPPTPLWARPVFAVIGLAAVAGGVAGIYNYATTGKLTLLFVLVPVGLGCLYKAFTR